MEHTMLFLNNIKYPASCWRQYPEVKRVQSMAAGDDCDRHKVTPQQEPMETSNMEDDDDDWMYDSVQA